MTPAPDLSAASDQDVVAWARQGREEAYRELLRRYQRPVSSLIYRMVRERETAEDLTQETLVTMHERLDSYRPTLSFSSWIFKIATNTAVNHLKRTLRLKRKRLDAVALDDSSHPSAPRKLPAAAIRWPTGVPPRRRHRRRVRSPRRSSRPWDG